MSRFKLVPAPSFGAVDSSAAGGRHARGVTLQERSAVSLCSVVTRRGTGNQLAHRIQEEFKLLLPQTPKYVASGPVSFIWAGAGQWLAMADNNECSAFEQRLRLSLAETASIVDQSDGRSVIRISGPRARDVLAKGVQIDLHQNEFCQGDVAISAVAYMNVHFWQIDEGPTYEFAVFRSYARAFGEWLADSAAEYGVMVA